MRMKVDPLRLADEFGLRIVEIDVRAGREVHLGGATTTAAFLIDTFLRSTLHDGVVWIDPAAIDLTRERIRPGGSWDGFRGVGKLMVLTNWDRDLFARFIAMRTAVVVVRS